DTEVKALWKESEAAWGSSAENLTNNGNLVTALSAAAAENSTVKYIKLGKNVTKTSNASDYGFTVSGGDFTLDLNGYTISSGSTYSTLYVTNSGTVLTIVDSSGGTGGVKTTYKKYESGSYVGDGTLFRVSNGAQLVIEGGSYEDNDDALVMVGKGSSAVIRGGSFNSDNKGYGYILYNSGTITVEGGTFKALGDDCIINCENDSVTIVKGGAFSEENAYYGAIRYGVGTLDLSQMADPVGLTVYNSTNADVTPSDTTIKLPEGYCFYNTKTQAKAATLIYGTKKDDRHYTLGIDGTVYTITVNSAQKGKVSANKATAGAGMTVTLTLTPDEGYMVDTVTCNDGTQNVTISAVNGVYSFTMPAANVTISAAFKMEHYHNWQYTMVGTDTIKAVCTAAGCDLPDGNGGSVTLAAPAELTYSGSAIKADVTNTFKTGDTVAVVYSGDLTDGYPVNAGNYTASITLGGQTISAEYTIAPASIAGAAVTAAPTAVTYNGQAQKPDVAVSLDEKILTSDDYTVSYSNNTNAGTAKVTVTGKGNYIGTASGTFTIEKADPAVSDFVFTAPTGLTYDGLAKSAGLVPAVSITGMGSITVKYYQGNREVSPVNAGTYTVKIDVAGGANYKPATGLTDDTWTFTIDKAEAVITVPQAITGLVYDGSSRALVTAGSSEHGRMVYSLNGADWSEEIPAASNAGEYTVSYKVLGDANHKDSEVVSVTVTIARAVPAIGTVNGTIAANETSAAKAVLSRTDDTVAGSLTVDNTEADLVWGKNTVAYTFTPEDTDNYEIVKRETTVTVTDTIAPTGEVKLETNSWKELVNNVTFGLFFNRNVELEVSAADALSGEKTTEYLASAEAMTEDAVKAAEGWQAVGADGKIGITAADAEKYIYYIRITDKAGNTAYLSTDGMVFDLTAPVITGVTDGATYYTTQKVQIADANLADGIEAEQTLSGNVDTTYEVEVADKAGNTAKVTITMKPISILSEVIKDLTSDNVTSDSSDELAAVEDALEAVDTATATEAEKQIIADAKANIDNLQKVIEDAKTAVDNLNEAVTKLNPETITSADKEAVEKLIEEITAKKEDANLTEAQKDQLDKAIADSQEILEKIAADQNALTEALNAVKDITEEDVKEHKTQLEEAKTTLETLLNDDNYTAEEKAAMQEELDRIRELIKTAEKQINYNNIPEVQKPEVETAEGAEVELSSNGTKAEITVKEGYELEDVLVNGKSQGKVTTLTGLKTGDKVQVLVKKMKSAEEILMGELDGIQLTARSKSTKLNGKKAIKIWWYEADGDNTDFFDGYEVFRSVKRYSGFGKKPFFTTEKTSYTNNKNLKSGNTYYYKVRGYVELNGKKYYSDWSRKAWRTL
ncbi:MAG: hypothetical protein IKU09_04670, partial [Firmicutes bacterium]|nr:hypothetical protein [Bacillota bacterium]